ncbi:Sugar kinase of the NBD/HSP70 family, may contain an N-terminal HTH domain [Aliiroseovarius sediminilitoris]|uniref:Sugar kinase of the NBD/HSP70 family, may contain an N-terminal HTH domain n=1 Tax=Aliiroseovarius sediminilitoris TaxID=1173584 RepID=A0A1I0R7B1_9RHOB|nr:ROK family transcriptional regulator [Aliiroseovarius sediminilitoris]SEW36511.1 Sugar kinase of the NBD/HSP70 family, may contain an N-terminal HTH domain [Aliiroseovarius sediminilitoris]
MGQALTIKGGKASPDTPRRGSNQSGMRAYNERLVLSLIRQSGPLAKAEITRTTGLSAQTVSVIMRALEAEGLLVRGEPVRGKIGQPSVPMSLAKDGAFFFGLKVGRRSLDLVLTDFLGEVQHRVRISHPYPTPDKTVQFATDAVGQVLDNLPEQLHSRIAGLGIALPFQLWDWAETLGVEDADMRDWKDRDIAKEIGAVCDFPVFVCNDASAACGAELVFGSQNKPQDFLYVFVGFFIGGGLVLDGSLYTGRTGNAAALGSMMLLAQDGNLRQLVDVASLAVLEGALVESGDEYSMAWDNPEGWNIPDGPLDIWLNDASYGIAQAVLSSVCLIDVGNVLIDGWMPEHMRAELVRRVRKYIGNTSVAGVAKPDILEGSIGSDARALGAASLPLSERFLVERDTYQKGHAK